MLEGTKTAALLMLSPAALLPFQPLEMMAEPPVAASSTCRCSTVLDNITRNAARRFASAASSLGAVAAPCASASRASADLSWSVSRCHFSRSFLAQ